jgi:hypothetical protein
MELRPVSDTVKAPASTFTGDVYQTPITQGAEPSRLVASLVRFTPGARTFWHSHVLGQTLYVVEGSASSRPATEPPCGCEPATPSGRRRVRSTGTAAPRPT